MDILKAFISTINPKGGNGILETLIVGIVVIIVILTGAYCQINEIQLGQEFSMAFGAIAGAVVSWISKNNYKKDKEDEN